MRILTMGKISHKLDRRYERSDHQNQKVSYELL